MGLIILGLTGIALDVVMRFIGFALMPWTRSTRQFSRN
jgi:ABC-type nitrate/sulfonate/bicarbonate transport system permease component